MPYAKTVDWRETKRAQLPCCFGSIPNGSVVLLYPARDSKERLAFPTFAEAIEQDIGHVAPGDRATDHDWRSWWQQVPMTKVRLFKHEREPVDMWIPNGCAVSYSSNPDDRFNADRMGKRVPESEYQRLVDYKIWKFARIAKPYHLDPESPINIFPDESAKVGKGRQLAWGF